MPRLLLVLALLMASCATTDDDTEVDEAPEHEAIVETFSEKTVNFSIDMDTRKTPPDSILSVAISKKFIKGLPGFADFDGEEKVFAMAYVEKACPKQGFKKIGWTRVNFEPQASPKKRVLDHFTARLLARCSPKLRAPLFGKTPATKGIQLGVETNTGIIWLQKKGTYILPFQYASKENAPAL